MAHFRRWRGSDVEVACRMYGGKAVKECAEDLLDKSQQLVPYRTGELQASGEVTEVGETRTGNTIYEIRYESNKDYGDGIFYNAVAQHEDLSYNHKYGRQAKYLEQPYKENAERYKQMIADEIRNALRGMK